METMEQKTERNCRVQARYDELMREGKRGHYETMFRVVHEEVAAERDRCTKKAADIAIACTSMYADKGSRAICKQIAHEIGRAPL